MVEVAFGSAAVGYGVAEMRDTASRIREVVAVGTDTSERHCLQRRGRGIVDAHRGGARSGRPRREDRFNHTCRLRGEQRRSAVRQAVGAGDEVGHVAALENDPVDLDRFVRRVDDDGALFAKVTSKLFKWTGLSWLDRLLGGAFGLVRGALIAVVIIAVLLAFAPKPMPNWMVKSQVLPYAIEASNVIASLAPSAIKNAFRESMEELRRLWDQQLIESREKLKALERGVARPGTKDKPVPKNKNEK
jgi:catechol 2,3-dioxygenase-like lactoylglutathione lyase family enzyme